MVHIALVAAALDQQRSEINTLYIKYYDSKDPLIPAMIENIHSGNPNQYLCQQQNDAIRMLRIIPKML